MKVWHRCVLNLGIFLYVLFGGVVFHVLETKHEDDNKAWGVNVIAKLLANNTCLSVEETVSFIKEVVKLHDKGVLASPNSSSTSNWDIASASAFSFTIISTIGYGNLSPNTRGSRTFFVFYALIGIPLFLVGIADLGSLLHSGITKLTDKIKCCKEKKKLHEWLAYLYINSVFVLLLLFINGIILSVSQDWSYDIALYYIIVTLTTVGFGDYVAGDYYTGVARGFFRLYTLVWVWVGLTWFSNVISTIQELLTKSYDKVKEKTEKTIEQVEMKHHKHKETGLEGVDNLAMTTPTA